MKICDIQSFNDGTVKLTFQNDYVFEGQVDNNDNPYIGELTTDKGVKYKIENFEQNDIFGFFEKIQKGEYEDNRLK